MQNLKNETESVLPFVTSSLSRELELLIQCSRLVLKPRHRQKIQELLGGTLDWDRIFQLADYHRLTPLLNLHLSQFKKLVNADTQETLRMCSLTTVATNMRMVGELHELSHELSKAQIPCLFFKGPVTEREIYKNLALRPFLDLDIMVLPCDTEKAYELLIHRGYTPQFRLSQQQRRIYRKGYCELTLWRGDPEIIVDLHWDLFQYGYSFSMDLDAIWKARKSIDFDGREILTLSDDDWLFFACFHASKHAWGRIGWLVDIAEHLRQRPDFEWAKLLNRPEAKLAQQRLTITLGLLSELFDISIPEEISQRIEANKTAKRLIHQVVARWEHGATSPVVWPHQNPHYLSCETLKDRRTYLFHAFIQPTPLEWEMLPLPRFLYSLYYIIRPLRLIYRRLTRSVD